MRGALIVGVVLVIWGLGSRGDDSVETEADIRADRSDDRDTPAHSSTEGMPIEPIHSSPKEATGDSPNEADAGDEADAAGDNSIDEDADDVDTDEIPFAVWVEANGYRCAGSIVAARAVLTAAVCVARAVPRGAVTVGTAGGVDATRAVRAALSSASGLALLELSATLPATRPIVHAGSEAGGCGGLCHVARSVAPQRYKVLPARRVAHCPAALLHHAGAFCLHPVTLCQNDTGAGVTCGGKLCGVVTRSATSATREAPLSCPDTHQAAALAHWKHFLRCALDDRSCHGACQSHCTEHFFNIEGTTWANDKVSKFHDVSVEGGRNAFHHVYGDRDGSKSFHHADPGGGRPYVHTVGETTHYPHNAYHPAATKKPGHQQDPDNEQPLNPENPFHSRSESKSHASPVRLSSHLEHHEGGGEHDEGGSGGGELSYKPPIPHVHHPGEINILEKPRPKAIPSMTHEIPWTGDYGELTTKPPSSPQPPIEHSWPANTMADYDMVSKPSPTQSTPERTTTAPTPPPTPSPTPPPSSPPPTTKPASPATTQSSVAPQTTTMAPPLNVTKLAPQPSVPPATPPRMPPPPPSRSPPTHFTAPPGLHLGQVDHNQKFRTPKPKTTEQPFPLEPLRKGHKPHQYTNETRTITTEEIQQFDDDAEVVQATANVVSEGTLASEELSPLILLAVLLTF